MKSKRRIVSVFVLVLATISGYFGQIAPTNAEGDEDEVGVNYEWAQGEPEEQMMSVHEGFCVLTAVGGNFRGSRESVWIYNGGPDFSYWMLGGKSNKEGVVAGARCYPYTIFDGVTVTEWYITTYEGNEGNNQVRELDPDDSLCYLLGMEGEFEGGGELVNVNEDGQGKFFALAESGQGYIKASYGCLKMINNATGEPARNLRKPLYFYWFGQSEDKDYEGYSTGVSSQDAICVLNQITGKFRGGAELVSLLGNGESEYIMLIMSRQKDVGVRVTCYSFDQQ